MLGLKTQIWRNQTKSILLLLGFPFLLLGLMFAFFAFTGGPDPVAAGTAGIVRYGAWAFGAAAIWFVIAWFSHNAMIRSATHSRELTREEAPELYALIENLCISRGLPTPRLGIMDSPVLNAFASGIDQASFSITLTTGIIETLDRDELEAVLAHELTHILNRDVRLMVIAVIFVGILSFLCQWATSFRFVSTDERRSPVWSGLLLLAISWIGYLLATVIRLAISRSREYLADAGSVELTKNPDALIRALKKISGNAALPQVPAEMRQMMFENAHGFAGDMFATHPSIEKRIEALVAMGGHDTAVFDEPAPVAPGPWGGEAADDRHGPWG